MLKKNIELTKGLREIVSQMNWFVIIGTIHAEEVSIVENIW